MRGLKIPEWLVPDDPNTPRLDLAPDWPDRFSFRPRHPEVPIKRKIERWHRSLEADCSTHRVFH